MHTLAPQQGESGNLKGAAVLATRHALPSAMAALLPLLAFGRGDPEARVEAFSQARCGWLPGHTVECTRLGLCVVGVCVGVCGWWVGEGGEALQPAWRPSARRGDVAMAACWHVGSCFAGAAVAVYHVRGMLDAAVPRAAACHRPAETPFCTPCLLKGPLPPPPSNMDESSWTPLQSLLE